MSRLGNYLARISQGKPVDWIRFLSTVPEEYRASTNYSLKKVGGRNQYLVTILEADVESSLYKAARASNRLDSALHAGDSHKSKVSFAGLITYSIDSGKFDVSVCSPDCVIQSSLAKKQLVIIENKEVFYDRDKLPLLLARHNNINLNEIDVVLGDGAQITNHYFKPLFAHYDAIHCVLDYDLGGLMIFDKLVGSHGDRVTFSQVKDIASIHQLFTSQKPSSADFAKAIKLCEKHGLDDLKNMFMKTSRFLEQEVLLTDTNKEFLQ